MASSSYYVDVDSEEAPVAMTSPEIASNSPAEVVAAAAPTKKRLRSEVWSFFERIEDKDANGNVIGVKAKCPICNKLLNAHHTQGTKHLARHKEGHAKGQGQPDIRQSILSQSSASGTLSTFSYDAEKARKAIVRYVVLKNLPFSVVEDPNFEEMIIEAFNPNFKSFSRQTCQRDILRHYKREKEKLICYFQKTNCRFSLSSDIWTSRQRISYLCITAHWIDDNWEMQKRLISFICFDDAHTGHNIAELIETELVDFGIERKIFCLTLDNASNNNVAVDHLRCSLSQYLPNHSVGDFFHVRCMCHILNLIVQSAFDDIKPIISKIRTACLIIGSSQTRIKIYKQICKRFDVKAKKIPQDVEHRWNSTYLMLNAANSYRHIIDHFIQSFNSINPANQLEKIEEYEWDLVIALENMLKVFYDATIFLSGCYYPTITQAAVIVHQVSTTFNQLKNDINFGPMILKMELKYDKYFSPIPIVFGFGVLINPCMKDTGLKSLFDLLYEVPFEESARCATNIHMYFRRLFDEYNVKFGTNMQAEAAQRSSPSKGKNIRSRNFLINSIIGKSSSSGSSSREISELDRYLSAPLVEVVDNGPEFDILQWWKQIGSQSYPIISIMARDLLSIQVSTVASESAFSTGGRLIDDHRTRLDTTTVQAVMCLQDWWAAEKRQQGIEAVDVAEQALEDLDIDIT